MPRRKKTPEQWEEKRATSAAKRTELGIPWLYVTERVAAKRLQTGNALPGYMRGRLRTMEIPGHSGHPVTIVNRSDVDKLAREIRGVL